MATENEVMISFQVVKHERGREGKENLSFFANVVSVGCNNYQHCDSGGNSSFNCVCIILVDTSKKRRGRGKRKGWDRFLPFNKRQIRSER